MDLQVMSAVSHVQMQKQSRPRVQSQTDTFPGNACEGKRIAVHEETDINWRPLAKLRKSLIGPQKRQSPILQWLTAGKKFTYPITQNLNKCINADISNEIELSCILFTRKISNSQFVAPYSITSPAQKQKKTKSHKPLVPTLPLNIRAVC